MVAWGKLCIQSKILVPVCAGLFLVMAILLSAGYNILDKEKDSSTALRNEFILNLYSIAVSDREIQMEKAVNILIDTDEVISFLEDPTVGQNVKMVLEGVMLSIGENMGIRRYSLYNIDFECLSQHASEGAPALPGVLDEAHREPFRKCAEEFDYRTFYRSIENEGHHEFEICMVTVVTDFDDEVIGFVEVATSPEIFAGEIKKRTGSHNAFQGLENTSFSCATESEFFVKLRSNLKDNDYQKTVTTGRSGENHFLADKVSLSTANGTPIGKIWVINDETGKVKAQRRTLLFSGIIILLAAFGVMFSIFILLKKSVIQPMSQVMARVSGASGQVSSASGQIAGTSIQLADRSSQQAASLQTTSYTLKDLSQGTLENSENVKRADSLMSATLSKVCQGRSATTDMIETMNAIKESSDQTSKIISTINEIAFQTNLLALNAAVESARAGDSGKGFAVVAEEVRNLAQRSHVAANSTSQMIEEARNQANAGVAVVGQVAEGLIAIEEDTKICGALVTEISNATQKQTQDLEQINRAVEDIDRVVQQSAANAEESASTGEELSGQATELNSLVTEMTLIIKGS